MKENIFIFLFNPRKLLKEKEKTSILSVNPPSNKNQEDRRRNLRRVGSVEYVARVGDPVMESTVIKGTKTQEDQWMLDHKVYTIYSQFHSLPPNAQVAQLVSPLFFL